MNPAIGAFVGVSKQTEMLLMTVLALWVNIFDMAIFEISSNLDQVWNVEIDKEVFNTNAEYIIRMLLSGVVLVRTFTLHLYIAFLIAVFWPVCFGTRPTLMLPWLIVSAIKNLGTGLVSIGTGGYTCMIYGPLRPACLRFLLSQLIDLSPSFYMWFVGLSLYCDLKKPKSVNRMQVKAMEDQELNMALRRRKVKSMIDEDILRQQFESRSFQKKFLGTSAVEVNEIINSCSYDNLKSKFSRSLDSLLDVLTVQTELLDIEDSEPLDIDNSSTLEQKTAKLLGISMDEIDYIKQNRQTRSDFPVYSVQPQKKTQTIATVNSRYESPAKLLPETSLYSPPNIKPIRITKSELKSAKDFTKIESEFMQSVAEKEIQVHDLTQGESFESLTKIQMQMVYQLTNSSFIPDVVDDTANMGGTNLSLKKTSGIKGYGWENSKKNQDRFTQKKDRGKLEDVQIEIPTKYKFSNTMSDKSHFLLDEHCFLFDKESMLMKKEPTKISGYVNRKRSIDYKQNPSEEKQKLLNAPTIDIVSNTNTKFKDNFMNLTPVDEKSKDKINKASLEKMKENVINKKKLIQSEKTQTIKKKIISTRKAPSINDYSCIPVSHRNIKMKNGYYNLIKNKVAENTIKDNVNKSQKNSQETKLYTIEENKDIALISNHEEKNNHLYVDKTKETNVSSIFNQEERSTNKHILLKKENSISAEESKIPVITKIENNTKKNLKISSEKKIFKVVDNINDTSTVNKSEIVNKKKYIRTMELGSAISFLPEPQKEAKNLEEELFPKGENKSFFSNTILKTSQTLSEKILQILREKGKLKTDKISVEDIFKEKINKTEPFKTVNHKEFEFTAKFNEKEQNLPVKPVFRNKQLEFYFKEKITKTKDSKMEDLFKKKTVSERKDSKTSDKEKLGFPSYFSNKINRMITDACQIRKKSCKKINLFIKGPVNTNSKQRSKLSTIELFRKQSSPKTNLFDITRKLSVGKLEISPRKENRNTDLAKQVLNKIEINLFDTEEAKCKKSLENLFSSHKPSLIPKLHSLSKTSVHSNDKTINEIDAVQIIPKEKHNLFDDNSFVPFKSNENNNIIEKLNTSSKTNIDVLKVDEPICITKTKFLSSTNADTKETQFSLPLAKKDIDIFNGANCVKQTESSCKINLFQQKSNTSTASQKNIFPIITKSCKKLSEQAMNKIMSITKSNYSTKANELKMNILSSNSCTNTIGKNYRCKRLSEQARNKIISFTNIGYSNFSNREIKTYQIDSKLNALMVHGTCRKLSDFAFNELLTITSPKCTSKTSLNNKNSSSILFPTTKIENKEERVERKNISLGIKHSGIPINITKSEILTNYTYNASSKEDSNNCNKTVKATLSEKNNLLHLNESKSKVNRKNSIPVIKIVPSIAKIENNEIKSNMEKGCNDPTSDVINTKSVSKMKIPIKKNSKEASVHNLISSHNNVFLRNSNPNLVENILVPVENQNISVINAEIKNCKEISSIKIKSTNKPRSISTETVLTTKKKRVNKNCKWTGQDSISYIDSNSTNTFPNDNKDISSIKSETNKTNFSSKKEMQQKEKKECKRSYSAKNECSIKISSHYTGAMLTAGVIQTSPIRKEEKICNWTPQYCIQIIPSNNSEYVEGKTSDSKNEPNIIVKKQEEMNSNEELKTILSKNASESDISANDEEKTHQDMSENNNNEYQTNIPTVQVEKECKGTSQHRIKLISSTDINHENNPVNIEELINENKSNVIKVNHEHENNDKLLSSLLYETACNSNQPSKETKVCKGTSQHNIKLISSFIQESSSETNLCHNEKTSCQLKDNLYIPLKEEKVCKGSSHNYIKLISSNKEEFATSSNFSHKDALLNILKEYQSVPIMKEEKVCKGTSKHKIKLVSSYKKGSPNKINLFHTETEYKNNNKNENITIFKEEKICEGTLQHSIELISSTKKDSPSKTIVIVKEQLPSGKEAIPVIEKDCKDNVQKSSTSNRPSLQKNFFVNVNTANGKQNFTVIQKQKDDKESAQNDANYEMNLFVKNNMTSTTNADINNLDEDYHMETIRKMNLLSNTIQNFLDIDTEKLIEETLLNKTNTDLVSINEESNEHPLTNIKSSDILSSLIQKIETSIKLQESNNEDLSDETPKCCNYLNNQIDFSCQTSTLSKKILDNNPNEVTKKLSNTKSITKCSSAKSYHDLNLQKLAFAMTTNKGSSSKLETKANNENLSKDEKKDSVITLNSRSSRNASYVNIHKERLEKARNSELDLNKSVILQNCAFLEDGYVRLYNLLGVKQENFDIKTRKKWDTSINF